MEVKNLLLLSVVLNIGSAVPFSVCSILLLHPVVEIGGERGALAPYKTVPAAIHTLMASPAIPPVKAP